MPLHKNLGTTDIHIPYAFSYADAASRNAATGFVSADLGKFARQTDDNSIWILTATTPTWVQVGGSTGSVASVFGRTGAVVAVSGDYTAAQVSFSPNGNIASSTVQAAVQEVRDESVQDGDSAGGDLTGTYPNPSVANLAITDAKVAAANKDGASGTPSLRTLGTGASQACAGNDSRLSDSRTPTGAAGGDLGSTYPNPTVAAIHETSGPTKLTIGSISDGQFLKRSGTTVIGGSADPRDLVLFEHFIANSTTTQLLGTNGWAVSTTGAGSGVNLTGETGYPGIVRVAGSTASNGRSSIHNGDTTFRNIIAGGNNPIIFEILVSPRVSVASANLLRYQFGLGSGWVLASPSELTDGIYFRLTPGSSANWVGVVANASTRTTVDLGTAAVVGTWYRLGFVFTPGGTPQVQFTLNGSNVGSAVTTNIPSALLGPGVNGYGNGGTATELFVDYMLITQVTNKET